MSRLRAAPQTERSEHRSERYAKRVNPERVRVLDLLQMNLRYERCVGAELVTDDGRRILDFLSGCRVHNLGHNHPEVVRALQNEAERCGAAMIQIHVADLAGELVEKLCQRAGGRLAKAFFCSSGSEGVEAAIKFARAHTKRAGILSAEHAFHGLTCRTLSLMSDKFWSEGFGPLLPGTSVIPFGDLEALERERRPSASRRWWSNRFSPRPAYAFRTRTTCGARSRSAGATARCLCWTKSRPGCTAPGRFLPHTTSAWNLTWSSWQKP